MINNFPIPEMSGAEEQRIVNLTNKIIEEINAFKPIDTTEALLKSL
jgi:hypothetical protein